MSDTVTQSHDVDVAETADGLRQLADGIEDGDVVVTEWETDIAAEVDEPVAFNMDMAFYATTSGASGYQTVVSGLSGSNPSRTDRLRERLREVLSL